MKRVLGIMGAGALLLFAMNPAIAYADNGPHRKGASLTTDSCAGCHRAHTGQSEYLLTKTSETALCYSCHDAGLGADTDVRNGRTGDGGALRGGGFEYALLDSANPTKPATGAKTVPVLGTGQATTSAHSIDGSSQTAWGGGTTGAGSTVQLQCGSCHDPHGNGNYRILRPVANGGTAITTAPAAAVATISYDRIVNEEARDRSYFIVTTSAANTFRVTDPITIIGSGWSAMFFATNIYTRISATQFEIRLSTSSVTAGLAVGDSVTGGTVGYAAPNTISQASGNGTTATYTTWNVHGLTVGQKVTISGMTPSTLNVTGATITAVPSTSTFQVANTTNGSATATGSISSGIPDVAGSKVYTTTNYWAPDDHSAGNTTAPSAYIANVSQWCSSCHSRYLAGSGAWRNDSGDAIFAYRHRSQNGKENSPNCIQCHVAHGTNASVNGGDSGHNYANGEPGHGGVDPGSTAASTSANPSKLLRVDNRGTCRLCHGQQD